MNRITFIAATTIFLTTPFFIGFGLGSGELRYMFLAFLGWLLCAVWFVLRLVEAFDDEN